MLPVHNLRVYLHNAALQALALRDKRIYVLGSPTLPRSPVQIYLDIESDPDAEFVYLIGLVIVDQGVTSHDVFWADTKDQEYQIFEQFVNRVNQYDSFTVFCYGSYERRYITRMRRSANNTDKVDRVLSCLINPLSQIYANIYFPTYSNSLKDIGRYLGCVWTDPDASGLQSIVWRAQWERTATRDYKRR